MSQEYPSERFGLDRLSGRHIPGWRRLSHPQRRLVKKALFYLLLAGALVVYLFPIVWMFDTAIRPPSDMFAKPVHLIPAGVSLVHIEGLLAGRFPLWYFNSIVYALAVVVVTVIASTLGGYGLTRIDIPYKRQAARFILFGYMFPSILLAIPMYIFWRQLGMINTYYGLILAETATALPFSLWLMWKFFQSVPYSLEESAQMSGATRFRAFYQVALPMAKPGITAVAVFSYALSWGAYTIPKIIIASDRTKWPLTVGIDTLTQQNAVMWGQVMAASVIMVIPPLIFIFALQRVLLRGFRVGGI